MNAEIIAIGTELLLGQVVNTNATFLSEELASIGINVYYHSVVGDNAPRLTQLLSEASKRSELIILCGGLGPTDDDLTKETVAHFLKRPLVQNKVALEQMKERFAFSKQKMSHNNLKQTLIIDGGLSIPNPTGLALGCLFIKEKTSYLLLPGPPNELCPMFQQQAKPLLQKRMPQKEQLFSRVLRFYGIGESQLVTEIKTFIEQQTNPTIAPYAKTNEVTLRLTAKAKDLQEATLKLDLIEKQLLKKVGSYFYGYGDNNSLANVVVEKLKARKQTISAAESLTAGLFQSTLGSIEGVSEIYKGGFVTYSAKTKIDLLDIDSTFIQNYGTVSQECAIAMAEKTRELMQTTFALSFTGVAGPAQLEQQAVGTVWIGLAESHKPTIAKCYHFKKDREGIRQSAMMAGLNLLLQVLKTKI